MKLSLFMLLTIAVTAYAANKDLEIAARDLINLIGRSTCADDNVQFWTGTECIVRCTYVGCGSGETCNTVTEKCESDKRTLSKAKLNGLQKLSLLLRSLNDDK